jgi:hypothetical protein
MFGMLLLLCLDGDLKKFNLIGILQGEKFSPDLQNLKKGDAIQDDSRAIDKDKLDQAEQQQFELMDRTKGNFLALYFDTERLLRIFANVNLAVEESVISEETVKKLMESGLITDSGYRQIKGIRWLKDQYLNVKDDEVTPQTLNDGILIAHSLYSELYNWLYNPSSNHSKN